MKKMKTPERSHPSRVVPSLSLFLPERPSNTHYCWHVTSQQCDMTYYVITKWSKVNCTLIFTFYMPRKSRLWPGDLDLWPMTLSIELVWDIVQIHPSTNFRVHMSNGLAVRVFTDRRKDRQTDRRTDGQMDRRTGPKTLPRPLTREVIISIDWDAFGFLLFLIYVVHIWCEPEYRFRFHLHDFCIKVVLRILRN